MTTHDEYVKRFEQPYSAPQPSPPTTHDVQVAHCVVDGAAADAPTAPAPAESAPPAGDSKTISLLKELLDARASLRVTDAILQAVAESLAR